MLGGDHDSSGVELSNENSSDFQHQEDPSTSVIDFLNDNLTEWSLKLTTVVD